MNKTCTGSQEVQQFWQNEAVYQPLRTSSSFSKIPYTSSVYCFPSPISLLLEFGNSGNLRKISSFFVGVLDLGFLKDAKIDDCRYSVV